ncbi:DAK2 domain-containing protein [bacterium]|nr:MAG: DAK2 domain-containing protein [bacterium]
MSEAAGSTLDAAATVGLLRHLLAVVDERAEELNHLDSVAGDGDLGVTMKLGMKGALEALAATPDPTDVGSVLVTAGKAFGTEAPSTMGALLATALRSAGKTVLGRRAAGPAEAEAMLAASVAEIERRGGAKLGDKTLLDVLVPFQHALAARLAGGAAWREAFADALAAAKRGLDATATMTPRAGRSRWLAERSLGSVDAGGSAVYLLLEAAGSFLLAQ